MCVGGVRVWCVCVWVLVRARVWVRVWSRGVGAFVGVGSCVVHVCVCWSVCVYR